MKKIYLLLLMLVAGMGAMNAQLELKALVGTNFSTFTDGDSDVSAKAGYQIGAGLLIGDKFYVEPGLQFVKNSKTFTVEQAGDITFTQSFVKIPVYLGYHILGSESDPIALRLFAGPAISISGSIGGDDDAHQITKDDVKNAVWAIDAGVGLDILFLFVEVNYERAFTDHFSDVFFNSNPKNSTFLINAGVHFDF